MDSTQDTADGQLRIWVDQARQLLNAQTTRRPPAGEQRFQQDLATADPAVAQLVKKAQALRLRVEALPPPDDATATELQPFTQARQAALNTLAAAPLTDAALTTAAQQFLQLQAVATTVAAAVLQRQLRAQVNSIAAPLLDPSLQPPPDAEGAEWAPVQQAVALASATQKDLLAKTPLGADDLEPLRQQVGAAAQARDLALQAIQKRLREKADALLAKVEPAALGRDADATDAEWQPVATLAAEVQAALANKPTLTAKDLAAAEQRLLQLPATRRDVMTRVRERLADEEDKVRQLAIKASQDFEKQCKGKLAAADTDEKKLLEAYRRRLDELTKKGTMKGGQIAQVGQAAGEAPALVETVTAMVAAREALKLAREALHGDVRSPVERGIGAEPEQQAYDKARSEAIATPTGAHKAALEAAARDAVTALKRLELEQLKKAVATRSDAEGKGLNDALVARADEISTTPKDPTRLAFASAVKGDPEIAALKNQITNLAGTLTTAADYAPAMKLLPTLVDAFKHRAQVLKAEQQLSTGLSTTPSASGKSVDQRLDALRAVRAASKRLRADLVDVQLRACALPAGPRLLGELDTLDAAVASAQAATLEADCAAWDKKLASLKSSYDADITALRLARATVAGGAKYLKDKSRLYRSGGTPPARHEVETAIGASGDPGHTLAAWAYTWDQLLAEIRDDLTDGYLTQAQLEKLAGGTAGQRYVKAGNNHVSISFSKEGSLYRVTQIHVTQEVGPSYRYFYNVNRGVITVQASTTAMPNPTAGTPASFTTTADNLVAAHKSKFNCK